MCYKAISWVDSVFKIKFGFNFYFFNECDCRVLMICFLGFSFLLIKKRVSYIVLKKSVVIIASLTSWLVLKCTRATSSRF